MEAADAPLLRRLRPDEWEALRALRLAALADVPGSFWTSAEETAAELPSYWTGHLADPDAAFFGLFDGSALVGMTAVFRDREDPARATAMLSMSYVLPAYRGRGVARRFFAARLAWARERGLARAIVYCRASNAASRRAIERAGFALTEAVDHVWPDGESDRDLKYELALGE